MWAFRSAVLRGDPRKRMAGPQAPRLAAPSRRAPRQTGSLQAHPLARSQAAPPGDLRGSHPAAPQGVLTHDPELPAHAMAAPRARRPAARLTRERCAAHPQF